MEPYYTAAFQVRYIRPDTLQTSYGIAYHEFVVDLIDGFVFSTKRIIERAPCDPDDAIFEYCSWENLQKN